MADKIRFILLLSIIGGLYFCSEPSSQKEPKKRTYRHLETVMVAAFPNELFESSGLLYNDKKLFTINDNGDLPYVYRVDTATGSINQKIFIENYPNIDFEDITGDSNFIYVGDFGNNYGTTKNLKILKIRKTDIKARNDVRLRAEAICFSYKNQENFKYDEHTAFDCEAMVCIGNYLYLFSMNRDGKECKIYRVSKTAGNYELQPIDRFAVDGKITGAAYSMERNELLLIGYSATKTNPFLWRFKNFEDDKFLFGNQECYLLGDDKAWQIEAVTFTNSNKVFFSCESSGENEAGIYQVILD